MNPFLVETFLAILVLVYVFMGGVFIFNQKHGKTFADSLDKAILWGSYLFFIGCGMNTVVYLI